MSQPKTSTKQNRTTKYQICHFYFRTYKRLRPAALDGRELTFRRFQCDGNADL